MVKDLTNGKPLGLIIKFCLPLLIGNIVQQFYNIADTAIVGKLISKGALAAVGETGSVSFLVIGFVLGLCSGICIPISNSFGAGHMSEMRHYVCNAVYICAASSVILAVVTVIFTGDILKLMKTPDDIFEQSRVYVSIIFAGIPATVFYNILAGILRALGDSRTPLYFLIIAAVTNIVLDFTFIGIFHTGVGGAAAATVISQALSGILCLMYVLKKFPILKSTKTEREFSLKASRHLVSIGVPMALQFSITAIGSIVLQTAVNSLGSDSIASMTAACKVQAIIVMPMETLGITMATFCSQNLGAGKLDRIRSGVRQSTALVIGYAVFGGILMNTIGPNIALLFVDAQEIEILNQIRMYLQYTSSTYIFLGLIFVYRNAIQGLGYGIPAMMAGIFEMIARAFVALVFVYRYGYIAVCLASPAAWIAADILLLPVWFIVMSRLGKLSNSKLLNAAQKNK